MADEVSRLFDDYAVRFRRGERPDPRAYLDQAGEQREELAALMDAFLARAPAPEPDAETLALAEAWIAGRSPLVELRGRRGLRRDDLVDRLVAALALDPAKRAKVKGYVHRLESGLLDPRRIDRRVLDALGEILGARARDFLAWPLPRTEAGGVFYRAHTEVAMAAPAAAPATAPLAEDEWDEIDELFQSRRLP